MTPSPGFGLAQNMPERPEHMWTARRQACKMGEPQRAWQDEAMSYVQKVLLPEETGGLSKPGSIGWSMPGR